MSAPISLLVPLPMDRRRSRPQSELATLFPPALPPARTQEQRAPLLLLCSSRSSPQPTHLDATASKTVGTLLVSLHTAPRPPTMSTALRPPRGLPVSPPTPPCDGWVSLLPCLYWVPSRLQNWLAFSFSLERTLLLSSGETRSCPSVVTLPFSCGCHLCTRLACPQAPRSCGPGRGPVHPHLVHRKRVPVSWRSPASRPLCLPLSLSLGRGRPGAGCVWAAAASRDQPSLTSASPWRLRDSSQRLQPSCTVQGVGLSRAVR